MIYVIATICAATCGDVIVTTSEIDPIVATQCVSGAPAPLAEWLAIHWPGYRLAGWKCVRGVSRNDT